MAKFMANYLLWSIVICLSGWIPSLGQVFGPTETVKTPRLGRVMQDCLRGAMVRRSDLWINQIIKMGSVDLPGIRAYQRRHWPGKPRADALGLPMMRARLPFRFRQSSADFTVSHRYNACPSRQPGRKARLKASPRPGHPFGDRPKPGFDLAVNTLAGFAGNAPVSIQEQLFKK